MIGYGASPALLIPWPPVQACGIFERFSALAWFAIQSIAASRTPETTKTRWMMTHPANLFGLVLGHIHEDLEQMDARDRDDGGDELQLQRREIDLALPIRSVLVVPKVHTADKVLVTREDHDHQKICREAQVDQRKNTEDCVIDRHRRDSGNKADQLDGKDPQQHGDRDDQPKVHGREQPAAGEQTSFDETFHRLSTRGSTSAVHGNYSITAVGAIGVMRKAGHRLT